MNATKHDVSVVAATLEFLPIKLRLPLKFGAAVLDSITDARVRLTVRRADGTTAEGWGETPLSVGWAWPSATLDFLERETRMKRFCTQLAAHWSGGIALSGHAMEIGAFVNDVLLEKVRSAVDAELPHLAALICNSAFDLALHDAYGNANGVATYSTYNAAYMNRDLASYYGDAAFAGLYPADFFVPFQTRLPVWHLVGGKDFLTAADAADHELPDDGYPSILTDWIKRDGLKCLKVKLTGSDAAWDYRRMLDVGALAIAHGVNWLSPDFNCLVRDPEYVNAILDRLMREAPEIYGKVLYVEQPFPYDLEAHRIDVHSVSARKPLFMDESAHDWRFVKLGFELGWNGVALKVCKTQTGALLSGCWAKKHGMSLMVQDLTNPMLAIIPHVLLAAHIGTIMGVECNAAQFYPAASRAYSQAHPGLYERRGGVVALDTLSGSGLQMLPIC